MKRKNEVMAIFTIVVLLLIGSGAAADQCIDCHRVLDEAELSAPAKAFETDVHNRRGLGCVGCHGGDPTADDPEIAMDPEHGFRGAPDRKEIPVFCGSCHQDASFIKTFNPNLPTDQLSQYRTSVHGKRIAAGDTKAAVCTSCHSVHGIRPAEDPRSPVYPLNVVETCASCHGDAELMRAYGIDADQPEKYRQSVHYRALTVKNDLSAPTCNDCHGSHGATPPEVTSVSNVCGNCHPENQDLFNQSPHSEAFEAMGMGACEACHGKHEILPPSDRLLGTGENTACGNCHEADDAGGKEAELMRSLLDGARTGIENSQEEVQAASRAGMLMEEAEVSLQDAHQNLIRARVKVHMVSASQVEKLTAASVAEAEKALEGAEAAFSELHFRKSGLLVALILILLAIGALVLRIRGMES